MYSRTRTLLLLLLPLTRAAITNRTIDDTFGDLLTGVKPIYLPLNEWQTPSCGSCAIQPPLDHVFLRSYSALTWGVGSPPISIQFSFQGTAIYVYFILPNFVADGITSETLCNFTLDGELASTFHHIPTSSHDYEFNALVFGKDNLSNKNHTLFISTSGDDRDLFTSFDYANYTFDDTIVIPSASSFTTQQQSSTTTAAPSGDSHSTPIGAIVGGVVGGILILLIAISIILCLRRRRHRLLSLSTGRDANDGTFTTRGFLLPSALPNLRPPTFPSIDNDNGNSSDGTSSTSTATMRQAEIDHQIRGLTREMQALTTSENVSKEGPQRIRPLLSFRPSRRERAYMAQILQQTEMMRREIDYLQVQLHSDWARGLTDDPPPSYSAVMSGEVQ